MKHIISAKYRRFVLYVEFFVAFVLLIIFYNFISPNHDTKTLYISSSNIDKVVYTLKENGYSVTWLDKFMLGLIHTPEKGWYNLKPNKYGRLLFFQYLHNKKAETMDIVIYAGETSKELIKRLAKDMKLDEEKLHTHYDSLAQFREANIFAQRYSIARKADENHTISYLFNVSNKLLEDFEQEYLGGKTDVYTLEILLTIASIIQKESNSVVEMPYISSVIYNRLDKGMKLQMDSTLNYGKYSHTIVTSERIKSDTSPYNTYKHKGLPPYPLSSVTIDALKASISPKNSEYLFFMLNKSGEHNFSANYKDHLKNIKAFKVYRKRKRLKIK